MIVTARDLVTIDALQAVVTLDPFAHCCRSVAIELAGEMCAVHFSDANVAARFAVRYADLAGEPVRSACRHAFVIKDPVLGWLFWSSAERVMRWPHGDLPSETVAFLADAVALTLFVHERSDGMISLHAAAVGLAGSVAAIVGDSNVGKTTTALACARAGMTLYTDERALIDRQLFVHPFRRALTIRAAGLRLLKNDVVCGGNQIDALLRAQSDGDWNDVRISDLAPDRIAPEPSPLRVVFLLAGIAAETHIEAAPPRSAARASARWAHGAGAQLDKIARLMALFSSVPCYRLWLGTPDATACLITQTLERHARAMELSA